METEALLASSDWVSAGGLLLIMIGISFLVMEFFLPAFGLFGFAGVSAILIGVVQLHQTGYIEKMPVSINALIVIAIFGLILSALGGFYTWKVYRKKITTGVEAMLGQKAVIVDWNEDKGHIFIQGENWQAYSDKKILLKKDDVVLVSKIDGLKIKIVEIN